MLAGVADSVEAAVACGAGLPAAEAGEVESVLFFVESSAADAGVESEGDGYDAALYDAINFFFQDTVEFACAVRHV